MSEKKDEQLSNEGVSRRNLFHIIGSVPAAAALATGTAVAQNEGAHVHGAAAQSSSAAKGPYKRQTFDDHQWKTVHVLCDLIIPADERSGSASQAGVPEFLDDWIAFRSEQDRDQNFRAEILGGLMWLDRESNKLFGKDFADAPPEGQKKLLDRIAYPKKAAKED